MTLKDIVQRASDNGHYIVDIPTDTRALANIAPGVFGHCSLCGAHVRYYKGQAGGEAYQTTCSYNMPHTTTPIDQVDVRLAKYRGASLNMWRDMIMDYSREKGWATTPDDSSVPTLVALLHTELSELFEEYRNGREPNDTYYSDITRKPLGIPSELADVIIRALHFAGVYGIDVDAIVAEKHEYNLTREYRHGGKRL